MEAFQHTLAAPVRLTGVGVHTGRQTKVRLLPAAEDAGIAFARTDLEGAAPIAARIEAVCETRLGTVIGDPNGAKVSTIEHLMAALYASGVDNALVEVDGPEVPVMEGAALAFVGALAAAGRRRQAAPRRYLEILAPVEVTDGDKSARLSPAPHLRMSVEIVFDTPAIGRQKLDLVIDQTVFRAELAYARTFGFLAEVEQLRAAGLGRGASLENTIVVDGDAVMNPEVMRGPDDFVRHKMLDAVGDLALIGAPLLARYEAVRPGHALNNQLGRALLASPRAWRFVTRVSTPAPSA